MFETIVEKCYKVVKKKITKQTQFMKKTLFFILKYFIKYHGLVIFQSQNLSDRWKYQNLVKAMFLFFKLFPDFDLLTFIKNCSQPYLNFNKLNICTLKSYFIVVNYPKILWEFWNLCCIMRIQLVDIKTAYFHI